MTKLAHERYRARGLCTACGASPASEGKATCEGCRAASAKRRESLSSTGMCDRCGKRPICFARSKSSCETCLEGMREKMNRRNAEARSAGTCVRCRKADRIDGSFCEPCWFVMRAKSCGSTAEALHRIWERQQGVCALSGIALEPGPNASVDHIVPVCRGGALEESNLQWVALQVNYSKRDRTDEEFIAMCVAVARYRSNA